MKERIGWIVSLRVFACMSIVLLHVIGGWLGANWGGLTPRLIFDEIIIQDLVRWAVPVFFMISGYLLLNPEKKIDIEKIKKYILRMSSVLLTFGLAYCVVESYVNGARGISLIAKSIINLLEGNSWSHMWYCYTMLGLYFLLPVLRIIVKNEDLHRWMLLLLFSTSILLPTAGKIINLNFVEFIPSSYAVFYFLIGAYNIRLKKIYMLFAVGLLGFTFMLYLKLIGYNVSYDADNLFVSFYSIAVFLYSKDNRLFNQIGQRKIMQILSKYSFGIYIIHPLILNSLNKGLNIYPDVLPILIGELTFWVASIIGALIITWLITLVPGLRKLLI